MNRTLGGRSHSFIFQELLRLKSDHIRMLQLRQFLYARSIQVSRLNDDDVLAQVAHLIAAREMDLPNDLGIGSGGSRSSLSAIDSAPAALGVPTSPNPVYVKCQQVRRGFVDRAAWVAAVQKLKTEVRLKDAQEARKSFDKARGVYWIERCRLAAPGEFNPYNQTRMRDGKPPIGPDGFPMELEHREELSKAPGRALDADNIWEIFRRQHDFQHGDYAFRWHLKSFPRSPHVADLSREYGDPAKYEYWP